MKALMFGWEFPPHILGGLGTASYGLTKGMAENGNMDISFVIPKPPTQPLKQKSAKTFIFFVDNSLQ